MTLRVAAVRPRTKNVPQGFLTNPKTARHLPLSWTNIMCRFIFFWQKCVDVCRCPRMAMPRIKPGAAVHDFVPKLRYRHTNFSRNQNETLEWYNSVGGCVLQVDESRSSQLRRGREKCRRRPCALLVKAAKPTKGEKKVACRAAVVCTQALLLLLILLLLLS